MRLLRCKNQNCLPAMRLAQSSTAKQMTTIFFIVFPVMSYQEMQQKNAYIVDERGCKCIYIICHLHFDRFDLWFVSFDFGNICL